jgi:predicted AlkP superfamily phosphohydrolase/phosphomutase
MSHRTKLLFIGVDAVEKDIMLPWAREGKLPNIKKLLDRGAYQESINPHLTYVGSTWSTFSTGSSPVKHQRYCFLQLKPDSYEFSRPDHANFRDMLFWKHLSDAGQRVAVVDIPKTEIIEKFNGIQVVDWMPHDAEKEFFQTNPPDLKQEINNTFGVNPLPKCDAKRTCAADFKTLISQLKERIRIKREMLSHYLRQGGWDCFMTVLAESHCAGHHLWHLHDHDSPQYRKEWSDEIGDGVLEVYQALDQSVGRLVEDAGDDATVVFLASHGMGNLYTGNFLLNEFLRRLEKVGEGKKPDALPIVKRIWRLIPISLRRHFFKKTRQKIVHDYSDRLAFPIPNNDAHGGIRINLLDREPRGKVRHEEYNQVCDNITRALKELINPDTGEKLVLEVTKAADMYPGQDIGPLPDLLIDWNRQAPIRAAYSDRVGRIDEVYSTVRTGDHRANGFFICCGPKIQPGKLKEPVHVEDYAPTIADILNQPLQNVYGKSFLSQLKQSRDQGQ